MSVSDNQVLKAVLELVYPNGQIAQNVFWFLTEFAATQQTQDVLDAIETYMEDFYTPITDYIKANLTDNPGDVSRMLWNDTLDKWEVAEDLGQVTPAVPHTSNQQLLPHQVAPYVVGNTERPKSRGRKFLIGLTEDATEGGTLVPLAATALGLVLNYYLADELISAGNELIVGVASTVTGQFLPFTDGEAVDVVGTQRRRRLGVGI